jgi:phosphoserine phosphatase
MSERSLSLLSLARILDVTRQLAAPFDLDSMLAQVVEAAKSVLEAEGGSVWLADNETHELVMRVGSGIDTVRVPIGRGIVGECARSRTLVNVPDAYADPRFNPEFDKRSGYRTRCLLTLPLIGHDDSLVGVLQIVNRRDGVFDGGDEQIAMALAAQCAVALQRVAITERLVAGERLHREISVAREVQMSTLPAKMPEVEGYDLFGSFVPTDETGGDTYDIVRVDDGRVFVLMADATGHGIGPAISVTQMQAMLRVALRLGASLDDAYLHINNQLVESLPEDRFVTAFLGLLDPRAHEVRYHAGGQGPLLHFKAATGESVWYGPTLFPMGAMPLPAARQSQAIQLEPGDVLALLSDGVYEYMDPANAQFGEAQVAAFIAEHRERPMAELGALLLKALRAHGKGATQADDVTIVLVRRLPGAALDSAAMGDGVRRVEQRFARSFDSLAPIFEFTGRFAQEAGFDDSLKYAVDFTVEELFTNMVKYNAQGRTDIALVLESDGVTFTGELVDDDSERWDPTAAPDADVSLGAEDRRPGGLGLHLIRRVMDGISYGHEGRQSTIIFRRALRKG